MFSKIEIKECHIHIDSVDANRVIEKLSSIEANLGALIMGTTEEVLAAVATEKQEVADAQAAKDAVIADRDVKIAELNARVDELTAGGGATAEELEVIKAAIADIITPESAPV